MAQKSTLQHYRVKVLSVKEPFYDSTCRSKTFFQARVGDLAFRYRSYKWDRVGSGKTCLICKANEEENLEHFLFKCDVLRTDQNFDETVNKIMRDALGAYTHQIFGCAVTH